MMTYDASQKDICRNLKMRHIQTFEITLRGVKESPKIRCGTLSVPLLLQTNYSN